MSNIFAKAGMVKRNRAEKYFMLYYPFTQVRKDATQLKCKSKGRRTEMTKNKTVEMLPPDFKMLLDEINSRKAKKNASIQYSPSKKRSMGDVIGNTSSCNDSQCGGGSGNVQACDDFVCSDPGSDPNTVGNTSSCGDWQCK